MDYLNWGSSPRLQNWKTQWHRPLVFVVGIWAISRLVVIIMMQVVAPLLPFPPVDVTMAAEPLTNFTPQMGWDLFTHWDGYWYAKIAREGYEYVNDGGQYSIAFFPLFPLLVYLLMQLGLPFAIAGTLVNNLAFLGALAVLYRWIATSHGANNARWATAVLAWSPFSLFATITYTEGLFILCTTVALYTFEQKHYRWAALWGALATATRAPGMALVPTFLILSWREKRPPVAYLTAIVASSGLLLFSLYCAVHFHDPLAFWRVQKGWHATSWGALLLKILIKGPFAVDSLLKLSVLLGSSYLFWRLRRRLNPILLIYGCCALALLVASGATGSFHRFVFSVVPISLTVGLWLAQYPRLGYGLLTGFALGLAGSATYYAWWGWIA
jgi:Gpi18-like mannosyltransferase